MIVAPLVDFEDKSFKNFFSSNLQSMLITDPDFLAVLAINDAVGKTYGYTAGEIVLQSVEKIIPQKEIQKLLKLASDTAANQQQIKKEISLVNQLGKTVYGEVIISSILFEGKEARLFTITDVTEKQLYRNLLEEAVEEEIILKNKNMQLKKIAYLNFHLARKPLANILGLVSVMDQSAISDQTLLEAIEFLKESGHELDELIKGTDPQLY